MTTNITSINEVDLIGLSELVERFGADPSEAVVSFMARSRWTGGIESATEVRHHPPVVVDEPENLGGHDVAPNPVEYVLIAFGSCLTVGYAAVASVRGIELRSLEIEIEGILDLRVFLGLVDGHAGYERIEVTACVESDASAEELEALHQAVVATSPVGHTLQNPVELVTRLVKAG